MPCCSNENEQSLDDGQDSLSGIEEIEADDLEDNPERGGKSRWKKTSKVIAMSRPRKKEKSKDKKTFKSLAKLKLLFGGEKNKNGEENDDEDRVRFKTIATGSIWNYKLAKMNSDESQESRDKNLLKNITFKKLVKVNRMLGRLQGAKNKVEQSQGMNQEDLFKKINFKRLAKLNLLLGAHKKNSTTREQLDQLCEAFDNDENLNLSDLLISTDDEEEEILIAEPKEALNLNTLKVVSNIKSKPSFNVPNNHLTLKRPKLKDTGIKNGMTSIANQSPVHVQAELKRIESVSMAPEPNVVRQISKEIKTFMNRSTSKGEKRTKIEILRSEIDRLRVEIGKLNEIKEVTGADLREINPIVKAAQKKTALPLKAINQIKGVRINPPKAVQLVMAAICIFKGLDPEIYFEGIRGEIMVIDYWSASQKLLSGFLIDELKDLRKPGVVTPESIVEFQETIVPELDFDRKKIERAYPYCAILYDWILRIEQYAMLIAHIKLIEKEKIVADAEAQIISAKSKVLRIKARIEKLELKNKKPEENEGRGEFRLKLGSKPKERRRTSVSPRTPKTP